MNRLEALLCVTLLAAPMPAAAQSRGYEDSVDVHPVPATPARVDDLLHVQPFRLAEGFWNGRRGDPLITAGVLVVLAVDPALVVPRDSLEPVLYAGNMPIQRLNHGHRSGRVIAMIPGNPDLRAMPFWFGTPELPDRITPAKARSERARAEAIGIKPFPAAKIRQATRPAVALSDVSALMRDYGAALVLRYSPGEQDLVKQWRLPVARAPSRRSVRKR